MCTLPFVSFRVSSPFCRNRPLIPLRTLTTYLVLVALLFSNVAGLVHVGCADSPVACQQSTDDHAETKHHCCHHSHCASTTEREDHSERPQSSSPCDQHDSDRCSVCQTFFATRHAVPVIALMEVCETVLIERLLLDKAKRPTFLFYWRTFCPRPSCSVARSCSETRAVFVIVHVY